MPNFELVSTTSTDWNFREAISGMERRIPIPSHIERLSPTPRVFEGFRVFVPADATGSKWDEWDLERFVLVRMGVWDHEIR